MVSGPNLAKSGTSADAGSATTNSEASPLEIQATKTSQGSGLAAVESVRRSVRGRAARRRSIVIPAAGMLPMALPSLSGQPQRHSTSMSQLTDDDLQELMTGKMPRGGSVACVANSVAPVIRRGNAPFLNNTSPNGSGSDAPAWAPSQSMLGHDTPTNQSLSGNSQGPAFSHNTPDHSYPTSGMQRSVRAGDLDQPAIDAQVPEGGEDGKMPSPFASPSPLTFNRGNGLAGQARSPQLRKGLHRQLTPLQRIRRRSSLTMVMSQVRYT